MTVVKGSESEPSAQGDMLKHVLLIDGVAVLVHSSRDVEQCLGDISAMAQDTC